MLHSVSADNKFFERPTAPGTPATDPDTGAVTYPDTAAPARPGLGTVVKVQLYRSRADLADLALDNGGVWTYSWDDAPSTSAVVFGVPDGDGNVTDWSDPIWSTQSLDVMAGLPDEVGIVNERLADVENEVAAIPTSGGGGSQILTQEAGGYPGKTGTGNALWVGKDKPPIGGNYASGDDLYFQTTSI